MSLEYWKTSNRPNYATNVDFKYPYSELPFIPQYKLVKIPITGLIEHVDYWGEGRLTEGGKNSGFRACYNVNRQYQLVSNGSDAAHGRKTKIPNRIPVRDENECDTRAYIKDDSVKLVTLMGAPIIDNSARDITRIVNKRVGMVVIYSWELESDAIKTLIKELKNKLIVHCPDYEISDYLKEPTLMRSHLTFLNEGMIKDELFKYVSSGDYNKAVTLSKSLQKDDVDFMIKDVVSRLLGSRESNIFGFANKLWSAGFQDLVNHHFPDEVKLIIKQDKVKLIGKYWNLALKLDANTDTNDRLTWGDSQDKSSYRVSWKLIPVWEKDNLVFKIMNTEHTMYLKLDVNTDKDGYGDREVWGSNSSNEKRHLWKLIPVLGKDGLLFLIINYEYGQGLKLNANTDDGGYGDRQVWGHNGNVGDSPEYYGWLIKAWP